MKWGIYYWKIKSNNEITLRKGLTFTARDLKAKVLIFWEAKIDLNRRNKSTKIEKISKFQSYLVK